VGDVTRERKSPDHLGNRGNLFPEIAVDTHNGGGINIRFFISVECSQREIQPELRAHM
jgi:hypothetical protein